MIQETIAHDLTEVLFTFLQLDYNNYKYTDCIHYIINIWLHHYSIHFIIINIIGSHLPHWNPQK